MPIQGAERKRPLLVANLVLDDDCRPVVPGAGVVAHALDPARDRNPHRATGASEEVEPDVDGPPLVTGPPGGPEHLRSVEQARFVVFADGHPGAGLLAEGRDLGREPGLVGDQPEVVQELAPDRQVDPWRKNPLRDADQRDEFLGVGVDPPGNPAPHRTGLQSGGGPESVGGQAGMDRGQHVEQPPDRGFADEEVLVPGRGAPL